MSGISTSSKKHNATVGIVLAAFRLPCAVTGAKQAQEMWSQAGLQLWCQEPHLKYIDADMRITVTMWWLNIAKKSLRLTSQ